MSLVRELNTLKDEIKKLQVKLDRMEQHEGEDGTPEDVEGQCKLVDEIATKQRRVSAIRKELGYTK